MGFQTKIILTFISMLSCVSVMTAGIVAILYSNNFSVTNNETIVMQSVVGDLYGYRFGAGYGDIYATNKTTGVMEPVLLYKAGEKQNTPEATWFTENVTWAPSSQEKRIEYIFYYEIGELSDITTIITLTNNKVIDSGNKISEVYADKYQYIVQQEEPLLTDWEDAPLITEEIIVDHDSQYVWLRAMISVNKANDVNNTFESFSFSAPCTWSFSFTFASESA